MSKAVKIPDYMKPNYVVTINGVRYSYPAGTTQVVPDCVASAIQHYYDSLPKEDPPETVEEMIRRICGEMIEASKPDEYYLDFSDIELSSTATDVNTVVSKDLFDKITSEERPISIRSAITYDDGYLETVGYTVAETAHIHFVFPHATDGVIDALIDVDVFCPNKIVKATLNVTSLG